MRLMSRRLEVFEKGLGKVLFIFVLIIILMQCVALFTISYHSLRTLLSRHLNPLYGPKPFSELGEHNDFHLQKRRLYCILSIAARQLILPEGEGCNIQLIEERWESLH